MSYPTDHNSPGFFPNYILAAISASLARTVVVPIEKIQLLLKTEPNMEPKYKNIFDCIIKESKEHGPSVFWRSNFYFIANYFPHQALNFAFRDTYKEELYSKSFKTGTFKEFFLISLTSGGLAGGTAAIFTYPWSLARMRLLADASCKDITIPRQFVNIKETITRTYKKKGVNGLYEGFGVTFFGSIVYRMCYFGGYDIFKRVIAPDNSEISFLVRVCAGLCVSVLANAAAYPFNIVRKNVVSTSGRSLVFEKKTSNVIKRIYQTEGVKGFYKQFSTIATKPMVLANALALAFYDDLQGILNDFMNKKKRTKYVWE